MNGLVQRPVSTQRQLRKGLLRNLAQDLDGSSALLSHCYCQILTPFEPNFIYLPVLQSILNVVSPSYFLTNTLEPRHNEGEGDWQNVFAIMRFRCNEVLFHAGTKNIARYTEDFVRSRLHCATQSNHQLSEGCNVDVFSSWLQSRWNRWQFSPDTSGIPSSLGSGNTRVTPTLVPTHSKPSSAAKAVA